MKHKKWIALALATFTVFLFSARNREKENNIEYILNKETDTYRVVSYTDTTSGKVLTIPDTFNGKKVTAIGEPALPAIHSADTLEKIVLGKNIEIIEDWGIGDCRYLKRIEVSEENENFCDLDGVLYSKDKTKLITYPNAHSAVYSKSGKLEKQGAYAVPEGCKIIGHSAFYKCYGLGAVTLPSTLEVIEEFAFHKCEALTKINFPEGLTTIQKDAFLGCTGLTEITLPSTIRELGQTAFFNALNIKEVRIKTAEKNVKQGERWFPTSAGRSVDFKLTWDYKGE